MKPSLKELTSLDKMLFYSYVVLNYLLKIQLSSFFHLLYFLILDVSWLSDEAPGMRNIQISLRIVQAICFGIGLDSNLLVVLFND